MIYKGQKCPFMQQANSAMPHRRSSGALTPSWKLMDDSGHNMRTTEVANVPDKLGYQSSRHTLTRLHTNFSPLNFSNYDPFNSTSLSLDISEAQQSQCDPCVVHSQILHTYFSPLNFSDSHYGPFNSSLPVLGYI